MLALCSRSAAMAETTPPKPAFAPTRSLPLPGGAKLVFCSGVTARGSAA